MTHRIGRITIHTVERISECTAKRMARKLLEKLAQPKVLPNT